MQYRRSGATAWGGQVGISGSRDPLPSNSTSLPALVPGTEYDVRVRARSAAGEGEWSEVQSERTFNSEQNIYF